MQPTLCLSDLLKLSILQAEEMQDLTSSKVYTKRKAYRQMLCDSAWDAVMNGERKSA